MPRQRAQPKVQRWTDLLAALLRYHYPVEFAELKRDVPAYAAHTGTDGALMRMFERDKDELRALGVPIETLAGDDGNVSRYRLASRSFYLPYLTLAGERAAPKRPRGPGYQSLPVLAFEPDELDAVVRAGQRVQQLGDPDLAEHAATALRKLAHDLPAVATAPASELIATDDVLDPDAFDVIVGAVRRRKQLTFSYFGMRANVTAQRTVHPYGIAYVSSHWYLIAHDPAAQGLRQFRMSRMRDVSMNAGFPATPDFTVPETFDLWEHARSRQAWELGDADAHTVVVRFTSAGGASAAAARLGEPVAGDPALRGFRVRRTDVFLRWVLGFAGAAIPVEPPAVVAEFQAMVASTLQLYQARDA